MKEHVRSVRAVVRTPAPPCIRATLIHCYPATRLQWSSGNHLPQHRVGDIDVGPLGGRRPHRAESALAGE